MEFVRKHVGTIAGVAVGGMVLWLITSAVTVQTTATDNTAGSLFGKTVSLQDYTRALESATRMALMQHGEDFRDKVPAGELEHRAWERLTFLREARRKGIRVSDQEVIGEITGYSLFKDKAGRFDQRTYENIIKYSMGTNPRAFEEETRENIIVGKLIQQVTAGIAATDAEIEEAFHRQEDALRVTALPVPDEGLAREIADSARQEPSRITLAAAQLGKEPVFAGPFKRGEEVPGLQVSGAVFDPARALQPGEVAPEPIIAAGNWMVVRLDGKEPADAAKLDDAAKEKLKAEILEQKKTRAYLEWYLDVLKRANLKKNPPLGQ